MTIRENRRYGGQQPNHFRPHSRLPRHHSRRDGDGLGLGYDHGCMDQRNVAASNICYLASHDVRCRIHRTTATLAERVGRELIRQPLGKDESVMGASVEVE